MKKNRIRAAIAGAGLLAATVIGAAPAQAGQYCDGLWRSDGAGRACVSDGYGQVDDIRTDGGCVNIYAKHPTRGWLWVSASCGPIVNFKLPRDPRGSFSLQNVIMKTPRGTVWLKSGR